MRKLASCIFRPRHTEEYLQQHEIIIKSGLFNRDYYLRKDRKLILKIMDPLEHFLLFGWKEGRNPCEYFDIQFYLKTYSDVKSAGINPLYHYCLYGKKEGRLRYRLDEEKIKIEESGVFDTKFYLMKNPDLELRESSPIDHFVKYGWKENRDPSREFDLQYYKEKYPEIQGNPVYHYLTKGQAEGRFKSLADENADLIRTSGLLNEEYYRTTYADVRDAGLDPIEHYVNYGWQEGRNPSGSFWHNFYVNTYQITSEIPLIHYIKEGRRLGYKTSPIMITPVLLSDGEKGRSIPATHSPLVSILISAYNHWDVTANCIASIVDHTDFYTTPYEIILADDHSSDETVRASVYFPGLKISRTSQNMGFLANNNQGAERARGKYLVLLNNDTQIQPNCIEGLVQTFKQFPTAGIVGSLLFNPDGLTMDSGNLIKKDGSGDCWGRGFAPNHPAFSYVRSCHYVTAACLMIRLDLWQAIGGFDKRYAPSYCEDMDLALEVRKRGYDVLIQPFSRVVHLENVSYGKSARKRIIANTIILKDKWKAELAKFPSSMGNAFLDKDISHNGKTIVVIEGWVPAWDTNAGARSFLMFIQMKKQLGYNVKLIFLYSYPKNFKAYVKQYQKLGFEVWQPEIHDLTWKEWIYSRRYAIDSVFIHRPDVAEQTFDWVKKVLKKPIIYFNHDLHFLRKKRELQRYPQKYTTAEIDEMREKELKYISEATISLSPSLYEIEYLKKNHNVDDCNFIPLYVYEGLHNFDGHEINSNKKIIFVAGFSHEPNVAGCIWFMEKIWPDVIAKNPEAHLNIVGSNPTPEIVAYGRRKNVTAHGFVSDEHLAKLYQSSRVSVIPLLTGAGMKGKLIESMYHGVPVVGTSIALEGCPDIQTAAVAKDKPVAFVKEITRILNDDQVYLQKRIAGFDIVRNNFSWSSGLKMMDNYLKTAEKSYPQKTLDQRQKQLKHDKESILKQNDFNKEDFYCARPDIYYTGMKAEDYFFFYEHHEYPFLDKNALVISPVSTEFGAGNSVLTKLLTETLQKNGYEIHYIYCPTDASENLDNGKIMPWDHIHRLADSKNKLLKLIHGEDGKPLKDAHLIDDWISDELMVCVKGLVKRFNFDICLCNYIWLTKPLEYLPASTTKILETHDKFSYRDTDVDALAGKTHSGWYSTIPSEEKKGLNRADYILAVKEEDAAFFGSLQPRGEIVTIGTNLPKNYDVGTIQTEKITIGYIAGVNEFNIKQIVDFYEAWARDNELRARTELFIAGSIGKWFVKNKPLPGANVEGFVDDIKDFYQKCNIIINPDFGGTGIKIKCLEALSYGKALICSEKSMRGIESDCRYHKAENMEELLTFVREVTDNIEELDALGKTSQMIYNKYNEKNNFKVFLNNIVRLKVAKYL